MKKRKTRIRRIYNNYDVYMYTVHNLKYGDSVYKGYLFENDKTDCRELLISILYTEKIIEFDNTRTTDVYCFKDDSIIKLLKNKFMWREEDNNNLNSCAIVLNLKAINVLKPFSEDGKALEL